MKFKTKSAIAVVIVAAVYLFTAFAPSAHAATTNVLTGIGVNEHFSPTNVTISLNDSVIWVWGSTPHSTTSGTANSTTFFTNDDNGVPSGNWDSGIILTTPHTFTNTFTSTGTFPYFCRVHFSIGMTGQVFVVTSGTTRLGITSPSNGAVFAAPANINIQAGVTNGAAAVTNVEFLAGSTLLTNEDEGPYFITANNLAAGNYPLSVVAQDNSGLSATGTVNISVVTPVAVSLTPPAMLPGNLFQFYYSANVNLNYVVQRSSNLTDWVSIATNTAASNPVNFLDQNATNNLNFYRVGRLPNP